ncbi:MAG: hypothetical protein LBT27_05250 [Prevotellaceae bacterium]|jgi:hypothetical protein|nr:hypothetical protein [Prevotellaceae bacterium]
MVKTIKKLSLVLAAFLLANSAFGQQEICVTLPQIQSVESVSGSSDINCAGGDVTLNLSINQETDLSSIDFVGEINKALNGAGVDYVSITNAVAPFSSITFTFNANQTDNDDVKNTRIVVFKSESQNCNNGVKVTQESCGK